MEMMVLGVSLPLLYLPVMELVIKDILYPSPRLGTRIESLFHTLKGIVG
jgi:hypothetical protein